MVITRRLMLVGVVVCACAHKPAAETVPPPQTPPPVRQQRVAVETVTVRDPDAERRAGRLEIKLLERDAQLADLQSRLDDTRQEVVRAMAKLQTLASRAEAASGMAEAEVSLRTLSTGGQQSAPEAAQVTRLLQESSAEFEKQNYAGALYLANQAKTLASAARGRLAATDRGAPVAGETPFALPVGLKTSSRGNVREGPGTSFKVAFAAEAGLGLTGYSYVDEWIRVVDDNGRSGWIIRSLVVRQ
jgi:hypothetical protein